MKLRINRSAKRLVIVRTNLDGFSLANHQHLTKLSLCQTFPLYSNLSIRYYILYCLHIISIVVSFAKLHIPTGASLEKLRRGTCMCKSHIY